MGPDGYTTAVVTVTVTGTFGPPVAPSGLVAQAMSSSEIRLGWADNADNEAGFRVERSTGGALFAEIATTGPDATAYQDAGLAPGQTYSYRMLAFNDAGSSPYSAVASATTAAPPLSPPTGLVAAVVGPMRVDLAWTDNSAGELGFRVERSTNGTSFAEIAVVVANVTTFSDGTVRQNRKYHYRVRGYDAAGVSAYSNVAGVTTPRK